jgi:(E)-4-hydroxy-3-methylbut-2-enyl-diphosphate synthase
VREVVKAAVERMIPIRIGVNSGSLEKDLLAAHGGVTAEAMVESALRHTRILEDLGFRLIKISIKASDIKRTLDAYRLLAKAVDYPFHAGITEAGTFMRGTVKSACGLGLLLGEGLADTVRVSLTAPPEKEVLIARHILQGLGLRHWGINLVSCPTCGRAEVDILKLASETERRLKGVKKSLTVAVMGCMVNGPGEAKEADIGVACGRGAGVIFKKGKMLRRVPEDRILADLIIEVEKMAAENPQDGGSGSK